MRRLQYKLDFGKKKTATMLSISCTHIGNPSVDKEGVHKFMTKAKRYPWIHHGDIIEGIVRTDKRWSVDEHKDNLLTCMTQGAQMLSRANKTCIGVIKGNHDQTPSKEIGDVAEYIANQAKVPYLTAVCFVKFLCPGGSATGFFAHGSGSTNQLAGEPERRMVNKRIWLRNRLSQFDADLKGMGHVHKFIVAPPCYEEKLSINYSEDNVKRRPSLTRPSWHYAAPSMFKTYDVHADTSNYGEMALYGATDLGWVETVFNRDGTIACMREVYSSGKVKQEHYASIVG